MKVPASIKRLRDVAPRQDWNSEALRPPRQSALWSISEKQMRRDLRRYGEPAVLFARWRSVSRWLEGGVAHKLDCPIEVAVEAVNLIREEILRFEDLPQPDGQPWPGIFRRISKESREEARRVASSVMRAWIEAGRPHYDPASIHESRQYITACIRAHEQEKAA